MNKVHSAQALVDYMLLIFTITAAFLGMEVFIRRAIQAKLKDTLVAMNVAKQIDESNNVTISLVQSHDSSQVQATAKKISVKRNYETYTQTFYF